ncbi:DUF4350 domain-containing protein [Halosimplex aquaticum]|uniref:DUF4350 domain-containing protein n=1 Tax=Halosimplex aquaticum TaxID=3026162 RepID=A0ABD5XZQ7_9EURY|nr:DUF4350 domain-containing protein [Halosimplex aquaticum]
MAPPWRNISHPRVLAISLALVLTVTLLYGGITSTTAFGAYNSAWDGAADLRDLTNQGDGETVFVRNTRAYADHSPNESVSFVLSPDGSYDTRDAQRVESFVRAGGTLVVAEDFGPGSNALLADVGAQARFGGGLLRDEHRYDVTPTFPLANNLTEHPYTADVDRLTLNRGTPVEPGNATVLATTTNYSYVDANQNGGLDDSETMQQYPVATVEQLGGGEVVAVGDPSLFINAMLERPGNRQFARNLLAAHSVRLVDTSHLDTLPPLVRAQFVLRDTPVLQTAVGFSLVVLVVYLSQAASLASALRRRLTPGRPATDLDRTALPERLEGADRSALEAWIRERHPDWDPERVVRVTDSVINETAEGGTDD